MSTMLMLTDKLRNFYILAGVPHLQDLPIMQTLGEEPSAAKKLWENEVSRVFLLSIVNSVYK